MKQKQPQQPAAAKAPAFTVTDVPVRMARALVALADCILRPFSIEPLGRTPRDVDVIAAPPFRGASDRQSITTADDKGQRQHTPFTVLNAEHFVSASEANRDTHDRAAVGAKTALYLDRPTVLIHPAELADPYRVGEHLYCAIPSIHHAPQRSAKTDGTSYIRKRSERWTGDAKLLGIDPKTGTFDTTPSGDRTRTAVHKHVDDWLRAFTFENLTGIEAWRACVATFRVVNTFDPTKQPAAERTLCCADDITLKRSKPGARKQSANGTVHDYLKVPNGRVEINLSKRRCIECGGLLALMPTKEEREAAATAEAQAADEAKAQAAAKAATAEQKRAERKAQKDKQKGRKPSILNLTRPTAPQTEPEPAPIPAPAEQTEAPAPPPAN